MAGLTAASLAGCGGGRSSAATTTVPAAASSTASPTTQPSPPAPTASTATASAGSTTTAAPVGTVASATRCHSADLAITDDGGQGAAGEFLGLMVFRNIASRTCTIYGYPGLQRLDANGQPMPTTVKRVAPAPLLFSLQPQQQATLGYDTRDQSIGDFVCTHATTVEVTPPDETTHVNVKSTLDECEPLGTVSVGALRPGKLSPGEYFSHFSP
ncbi:MAG: DUF4232 domain-containing protein [Actinomycetota bacterium]|nr:DUF4232 domain-containing protein [Actinomycetota bacterium]